MEMNGDFVDGYEQIPSATRTDPRSSESRFHRAVILCLGLLSLFLLAGLVGLCVYNSGQHSSADVSTVKGNLTERLQAKLSSVSEERDLLNARLTELTEERDRLQSLSKQKKTCPTGWRMFSCSCYLFSTMADSWEHGRDDCRGRGADLVIIDSYEKQEFITETIKDESWIGLSDRDNEGTWKWIDGTPLTLGYWWSRQPDNGGGDPRWGEEDCVYIKTGKSTGANWNDLRCDASFRWICEKMA